MSAKWFNFLRSFLFAILMQFVAFFSLTQTVAAQNNTTDHLALLAIKSMIKDDPQGAMTSWNHSITNFCQWKGVTCSAHHLRVIHLDLSSRGLIGTLSPFVGNLSFLRVIRLYNNSFSGEIPCEIGRLLRLQELRLSDNFFTGNIPATIMNCSKLQVVHLGSNNLVGKIPDGIGSLSMLNMLIVHENILEGGIPLFIANLTLLERLSLGDCQLGGSFPDLFQRLTNLKRLVLVGNNLTGTISPSLYNCSFLELVFLDDNQLNGRLHKNLSLMMPHLLLFSLSFNHIQGNLLEIPQTLKLLDLNRNEFLGSLHELLCSNGTKEIKILDLGNNHFSSVIPECWEKWPSLVFLNLQNNNLCGEIPKTLGLMHSLQLLNIRGNKISGRLHSSLMNLSSLKILQLGRNELVGKIPTWIGTKLTFLRIINLRSNNLYGKIPHQICYLSHVQILDLAHNNLTGNIPRCFNNFSVLSGKETNLEVKFSFYSDVVAYSASDSLVMKGREDIYRVFLGLVMLLDLSSNSFSGQIPCELMTLWKLKSLNLSRNQFSGKIPDTIGEMKSLESLDLSLNKLYGELPMSLSMLNFLSSFNVSYNNLIGRVPTSTQIQSFSESSFLSNKLCGPPLTNGCVAVNVRDTMTEQKEDYGSHGADWGLTISLVLGFVSGFWIVVAPLIASTSWRIYCNIFVSLVN